MEEVPSILNEHSGEWIIKLHQLPLRSLADDLVIACNLFTFIFPSNPLLFNGISLNHES
jgi:hypothetical protein